MLFNFLVLINTLSIGQCTENLLQNGDFESGNLSHWQSSGLPLVQSGCYNQDGDSYLWYNGSGSLLWQEVPASPGQLYTLDFYDGAHDIDGQKVSLIFLDGSGLELSREEHFTDFDVDLNDCLLEANALVLESPESTSFIRVEMSLNNAGLKADGFCLTSSDQIIDDCAGWIQGAPNSVLLAGVITNPGLISSDEDLVNVTFVVVNSSDHPVENIELTANVNYLNGLPTGNNLYPVLAEDPNGNDKLDPNEIWFYSAVSSFDYSEGESFVISGGVSGDCPCGQEIGGAADLLFTSGGNMDIEIKP